MKPSRVLAFITLSVVFCFANRSESANVPTVIVLSFDGARPDYFNEKTAPNFMKIAKMGQRGRLIPIFPSETFPNHTTLLTGCDASQHGIVSNKFYDEKRGEFLYGMDPSWTTCEPVWAKADRAHVKTAITYWPGQGQGKWKGRQPTYQNPLPTQDIKKIIHFDDETKFNQILKWLDLPQEKRPQLIFSWFADIDTAGHDYGPSSPEIQKAVKKYDDLLGTFLDELKKRPAGPIDLIIVSDHGMSGMKYGISLPHLKKSLEKMGLQKPMIYESGTNAKIYLQEERGLQNKVSNSLQKLGKNRRTFQVYTRETLPESWHYNHPRSGDIILAAKKGFYFDPKGPEDQLLIKLKKKIGKHGYPNSVKEMNGTFFATGPDFPKRKEFQTLNTTDIAPMIASIMGFHQAAARVIH